MEGSAGDGGPIIKGQEQPLLASSGGEGASPTGSLNGSAKPKRSMKKVLLIVLASVLGLCALGAMLGMAICYRGIVKMDFDPESDVSVTGLSVSAGSAGGLSKPHVRFIMKLRAFVYNPNNLVAARVTKLQAQVSYLNASDSLEFLAKGVNTTGVIIPGGLTGKRASDFVSIRVFVNLTAANPSTEGLVGRIGKLCENSGPKSPATFKIKIELTGTAQLMFVSNALNKVVEPMDIECPQSVKAPDSLLELTDAPNKAKEDRFSQLIGPTLAPPVDLRLRGTPDSVRGATGRLRS